MHLGDDRERIVDLCNAGDCGLSMGQALGKGWLTVMGQTQCNTTGQQDSARVPESLALGLGQTAENLYDSD